ncbi:right-handed parallel beta-helix repeat-containing protein, partial [candidate division KSB1 bacterium]
MGNNKKNIINDLTSLVFVLTVCLFTSNSDLGAANYYISSGTGDDSNSGLSVSSPWKTIEKVNNISFSPGDSILFKRGEVWREQLSVNSSGSSSGYITYSAYGSGNKPVIMGSDAVTGWSYYSTNNWTADITNEPFNMFFVGADGDINWGFKESSREALNDHYEWYWSVGKLYIYSGSDPDTTYDSIEAVIRSYGIGLAYGTRSYICVSDFEMKHQKDRGIMMGRHAVTQSTNWIIQNNTIHHIGERVAEDGDGIAYYAMDAVIRNNIIYETGAHGIYLISYESPCNNNIIEHNTVYNCYHTGIDVMGYGGALDNTTIRYNILYYTDDFNKTDFDYVANTSNAIYLSGPYSHLTNATIHNNLVFNAIGGGIHIGKDTYNINIYNNTLYKSRDSWSSPIYTTTEGSVTIMNNIGMNGGSASVKIINNISNKIMDYNCWYQAPGENSNIVYAETYYSNWDSYQNASDFDSHSINVDPLLVSPSTNPLNFDFHLKSGSPCINRGVDVGLTSDYEGTPVPQSSVCDIGAYEYTGTTGLNDFVDYNKINKIGLFQNYPNPFNSGTEIKYSLQGTADVILKIYNVLGKEINTLVDTQQNPGNYSARWDGRDKNGKTCSSGIYFCMIKSGKFTE